MTHSRAFRLFFTLCLLTAAVGELAGCRESDRWCCVSPPMLKDADGVLRSPQRDEDRASAVVLFFITVDCPIANSYAPEMNAIQREYKDRGVAFYAVHVDPAVTPEKAAAHAAEYGFAFPVLLDAKHDLVRAYGVTVTPEAVVIRPGPFNTLYRGRIDDRIVDFGKRRENPSRRDLREALDAILAGKPVPHPRTKAIGCFVPELKGENR